MKGNSEEARSLNSYLVSMKAHVTNIEIMLTHKREAIYIDNFRKHLFGETDRDRMLIPIYKAHNDKTEGLFGNGYAPETLERFINVDWFNLGSASQPSFVGWHYNMTTKHGWNGNYGGGTIDLEYRRFMTKKVSKTVIILERRLNWGDKIVLDIPRACTWKLIFEKYNGSHVEIASTEQKSPFITIKNIKDRQLEVQTVPYGL